MLKKIIFTVEGINAYIAQLFKGDDVLKNVTVRGEVSNCTYHSSGHIYFTLKDENAVIACVMFISKRDGLKFTLQEGQQIILKGAINLYKRDGKYQIYANEIKLDGQGELYERRKALKRELEEMGMFDERYKQPIPKYINRLGVVTSLTGAAIRDIQKIAQERNPYVQIILYDTTVQGVAASANIVEGIRRLEQQQVDTIIVGRGGGSKEELWVFNEREVVQAIFDCTTPIISAVGHAINTPLSDYVADANEPTPSAAVKLAVYDYKELEERLESYHKLVMRSVKRKVEMVRQDVERRKFRLEQASPKNRLREQKVYTLRLEELLDTTMKQAIIDKKHILSIFIERMKGLSPLDKLGQGYSYLSTKEGQAIKNVEQVTVGDDLFIQMVNGEVQATVKKKKTINRE